MAVSRNGSSSLGTQFTTSYSGSYTVTSGATLLVVGGFGTNGDTFASPQWNGSAMTQILDEDDTADRPLVAFYIFNPTSGTHNFTVTCSGGVGGFIAADYSGTVTSGLDSSHGKAVNPAATITDATTVVASNCWVIGFQRENTGGTTTWTGLTSLQNPGNGANLADSGGTVSTGSYSVTAANSGATAEKLILLSIAPSGGGGGSNFSQTLTDSITPSDTLVKKTTKVLADALTPSDVLIRLTGKPLPDTITYGDTLTKRTGKVLADSWTLSDVLVTLKVALRTLTESFTLSDSLVRSTGKALLEAITLSDTFSRVASYFRTFTESFTWFDSLLARLQTTLGMADPCDTFYVQADPVLAVQADLDDFTVLGDAGFHVGPDPVDFAVPGCD